MKKLKQKHSLLVLCITYFISYSLLLILMIHLFQNWIDWTLQTAFPTLDDLRVYEEYLSRGEYGKIPKKKIRNVSYIIFDENGSTVYSSDSDIEERIHADELVLINDSDRNGYYTVAEQYTETGELQYLIRLEHYNSENGFTESLGYCLADQKLNIIDGDLFADLDHLTEEEFQFIKGLYHSDDSITKYSFLSEKGEVHTLVCVTPHYSEAAYEKILQSTKQIFLILIPIVILGSIIFTAVFLRSVRQMLTALNQEIQKYQTDHRVPTNRNDIAIEFHDTLDALDNLLGRVEKGNRERQQMIAGLSHDLKTPLSVISGCANAFAEGLVPADQYDKYMHMILERSKRADELINSLFEYSKMEHADFQLKCETLDFCEYIKNFLGENYEEIETVGFQLTVDIPENPLIVKVDSSLFGRCLENILANALKYNPSGTTLYITVEAESEYLLFTFADNGVGVSKELQEHIFDSFVTGDKSRSGGKGTGLGLAIVKKIVSLHMGQIELIVPPKKPYATQLEIKLPIAGKNEY